MPHSGLMLSALAPPVLVPPGGMNVCPPCEPPTLLLPPPPALGLPLSPDDEHPLAVSQPKLTSSALTVNSLELFMRNPSQRSRGNARQIHRERHYPQRDTPAQLCLVTPIGRERRHHETEQAAPPRVAPQEPYDKRDMGDQV